MTPLSWMFSAIRSGDYYMFEELDDGVLEEKDETSSDDEGGRHGERRVTLSKVNIFIMEVCLWYKNCELICSSTFHGVISANLSHQESECESSLKFFFVLF